MHFYIGCQSILKQEWNCCEYLIVLLPSQHNKWFHIFGRMSCFPCCKFIHNSCGFKSMFSEYFKVHGIAHSKGWFPSGSFNLQCSAKSMLFIKERHTNLDLMLLYMLQVKDQDQFPPWRLQRKLARSKAVLTKQNKQGNNLLHSWLLTKLLPLDLVVALNCSQKPLNKWQMNLQGKLLAFG